MFMLFIIDLMIPHNGMNSINQSTGLLVVTHKQNEILHNNIESSREKHITQY